MSNRPARRATNLEREHLWQSVWGIERVPARSAQALVDWLDCLSNLSLDAWLALSRQLAADPRVARPAESRERLDAVISEQRLELVAWFVRDFVETEVEHAMEIAVARDRASRTAARAARDAVYTAALAIAARNWLTLSDYEVLSAPCSIAVGTYGTRSAKTLPPPSRSHIETVPPCASAMPRAIERPRPAPPASGAALDRR